MVPSHPLISEVIHVQDVKPAIRAKRLAVEQCSNDVVLLLDSDDVFSNEFFDRITEVIDAGLDEKILYCPSIADPYNFIEFDKEDITHKTVRAKIDKGNFTAFMLCGNYLFNKAFYLSITNCVEEEVYAADCMYIKYIWLKNQGALRLVPGLQYKHTLSRDGYFASNSSQSWAMTDTLKRRILEIRIPEGKLEIVEDVE